MKGFAQNSRDFRHCCTNERALKCPKVHTELMADSIDGYALCLVRRLVPNIGLHGHIHSRSGHYICFLLLCKKLPQIKQPEIASQFCISLVLWSLASSSANSPEKTLYFCFYLFIFFIVVLLQLSQFSCIALPCTSHSCCHSQSSLSCPCPHPWVIYTCSLTRPSPFLPPLSPALHSGHCQSVPCFHASCSILLICFGHEGPLIIGEIIWCLSFAAWFISPNTTL